MARNANNPPAMPDDPPQDLSEACTALAREPRSYAKDNDVAQEAYRRALEMDRPSAVRDPIRYMWKIARNLVRDGARKRARDAAFTDSLSVALGSEHLAPDPERILAGRQELRQVLDVISNLPPRCREAFLLHRFQELSYANIARRMGISTSMVEKHIAEAMLRIKRSAEQRRGNGQ